MIRRHARRLISGPEPVGYTASVYEDCANLMPLLISGLTKCGQLMHTTDVDNWPADINAVRGSDLMASYWRHASPFDTEIDLDHIYTAHLHGTRALLVGDSSQYTCAALIIATGASVLHLGMASEWAAVWHKCSL